jgi:hypothetical protein
VVLIGVLVLWCMLAQALTRALEQAQEQAQALGQVQVLV